ncbi:MAG: hypothetical protein ACOY42_12685 [Pseudomonadota bacterium]
MRVALLTPPQRGSCGVFDYCRRLGAALAAAGIEVGYARGERRGRLSLRALAADLRALRPEVLHVQYPMTRYGASPLPLLAALWPRVRRVVTLHEFSQAHPLRRAACAAFSGADALVFTAEPERAAFCRRYPWARAGVIPIGSNIPAGDGSRPRRAGEVCYFGQLRPRRGLEAFLALARLAAEQGAEWSFRVLGAVPAGGEPYAARIRAAAGDLPRLRWEPALDDAEVAARLAAAEFAYLPYPDGASERRSTLLAALGSGALVITSRGPQTPPELAAAVRFAADPRAALVQLRELAADPLAQQAQRAAAARWLRGRDWGTIAAAHVALYRRVCDGGAGGEAEHGG